MSNCNKQDEPTYRVAPTDTEVMIAMLLDRDWTTSRELYLAGLFVHDRYGKHISLANAQRKMRGAAEASGGEILGNQQGYKLTSEANAEEIQHCINRLRSESRKLSDRAEQISDANRAYKTERGEIPCQTQFI